MAIGETFLSAFLQVLFEQMLSAGEIQFLKMVGGVDLPKTVKKWKRQLTVLEALLEDAELQQFHSKPVKLWLNELQDLTYDIEDLLDHFATDALGYHLKKAEEDEANAVIDHSNAGILDTMIQNIYASGSRAADSLSTFLKPVDQHIRDKIDDITERLQDIQDQIHSLSLTAAHMMQQQTLQTETLRSHRESTSLVGKVFGRDDKKKEIITMLLKDDQNAEGYVVIPIVGTGGIGKTTLAQYVYNDEQRYVYRDEQLYDEQQKSNFDLKAWVCVSDVFDVKRVTIDIINSATHSNFDCSNLDQSQLKLQEVLKGKKFFIVLDDIWSEEYGDWYKLQQPFLHGAKGSRVIMTTRNESIARMMVNNPTQRNIIKLESLSNDDSWLIFQQHANVDSDLAEMRDNIIKKINGLPLAAKALGGLLKSNPDKSQRQKILESNVWDEKSSVLPVLMLSYHHMPSHLKRVFAYCSVIPKHYEFNEMEVVLLWMAQGFLPESQNETMEDMGHKYFNDLVSRSLFEKRISFINEMFMMHDLIHDVAQLAAGDICYVMGPKRDDLERIRHLFITKQVKTLGRLIMAAQFRTFLCYAKIDDSLDIIQRMHYVRTLRLVSEQIEVLPDCIGDLKHLRYVSLTFPRIKVLPQSISYLWNLQTLCLKGCKKLEKVPYMGSLEKLRHMYFCDTSITRILQLKEMPLGIGKLTNLQTLSIFVLAPGGGSRVRELGNLNRLHGSLSISGIEYVTAVEDAQEAQLHKKESLDKLHMEWRADSDEVGDITKRGVIENLHPHTNIKGCRLYGYMGSTFPSWLGDPSFSNMVGLTLQNCHKCECLPPLGQLPSLKYLWIENMDGIQEVGLEFYGHCSTPFSSLKSLNISYMESWEKWVHPPVDSNKAFPILANLTISKCPSLQGDLPPHLHSLTRLDIQNCSQLQSLELKNNSYSSASHLENLIVSRCGSMVSIYNIPLTLQLLEIEDCEKLGCLEFDEQPAKLSPGSDDEKGLKSEESVGVSPKDSLELPLLIEFRIERCPSLRSLQQNLLLPALPILILSYLENMERLPAQLLNFTSLEQLWIYRCPKLQSLGEGGLPRNLESVNIKDVMIKQAIQEWGLHLIHGLEKLELKNVGISVESVECIEGPDLYHPSSSSSLENHDHHSLETTKLNSVDSVECILCQHLFLPSSLHMLDIKGFRNLKMISDGNTLPNLTHLSVSDCPRLESLVGDFTSLTVLSIDDCPSLKSFVSDFTSLKVLSIENCPEFHNLPEGDLPTNLRRLSVKGAIQYRHINSKRIPKQNI